MARRFRLGGGDGRFVYIFSSTIVCSKPEWRNAWSRVYGCLTDPERLDVAGIHYEHLRRPRYGSFRFVLGPLEFVCAFSPFARPPAAFRFVNTRRTASSGPTLSASFPSYAVPLLYNATPYWAVAWQHVFHRLINYSPPPSFHYTGKERLLFTL